MATASETSGSGGIDRQAAFAALSDIDTVVSRVRQSRIYDLASQFMIVAGVFVAAGNLANFMAPRWAALIWPSVNVATLTVSVVVSTFDRRRTGMNSFDLRIFCVFVLFYAFGIFSTVLLGHYSPREMGAFWPIYFMLFYCIAGLWFGRAFIAIGLAITALTLIGYFFITSSVFLIWMAVVNGGGLITSGVWMRRSA